MKNINHQLSKCLTCIFFNLGDKKSHKFCGITFIPKKYELSTFNNPTNSAILYICIGGFRFCCAIVI